MKPTRFTTRWDDTGQLWVMVRDAPLLAKRRVIRTSNKWMKFFCDISKRLLGAKVAVFVMPRHHLARKRQIWSGTNAVASLATQVFKSSRDL